MLPLARPSLHVPVPGQYHCDDLHTLYEWLEAHEYHYYGAFGAGQFGRFVCAELAFGDGAPVEYTSMIEVSLEGTVLALDARAQQVLDDMVSRI